LAIGLIATVEMTAHAENNSHRAFRAAISANNALRNLVPNPHLDTRFYDALLPAAEGDVDKTLRSLRKLASPEAKSAIFNQLFRTQDAKTALDWLETRQIDVTDLDAAGALNVLLKKVETDDFDGALRDAEALTADQLNVLPSLYTVRCSLFLASMLPKDLKRIPFQGMPINPRELRFATTPQAATSLTKARADLDHALAALDYILVPQHEKPLPFRHPPGAHGYVLPVRACQIEGQPKP
jgi:hypothetical protein